MSDEQGRDVDRGWFADGLLPRGDDAANRPLPDIAESDPTRYRWLLQTIEHYSREISASVDPRRRADLSFEVGRIHDEELGDTREAAASYQKAIGADPTHLPTLHAARRLFGRAGRWSMVLRLIDAEIRVAGSPEDRARLLRRKAEIYLAGFDEPSAARVCLLQALDFAPDDAAAARGLTTAAALAGDPRAFAVAAERAARAARRDQVGRAMAGQAAMAWAALGDHASAVRLLERVLDEEPDDAVAACRLVEVHRVADATDAWIASASAFAERITDPGRRAARRSGIARLAMEAGRTEDAIVAWEAALADAPERTEDRRRLAAALEAAMLPARAAAVWSRVADELIEPARRLDALRRLADLYAGPLDDEERLIGTLRRILDIAPAHGPTIRRFHALSARAGRWRTLAEVLVHCAQNAEDPLRSAATGLLLGRVRETQLDDLSGAVRAYRSSLERDPQSLPIVEALARAQARLSDWRSHIETLEHTLTLHAEVVARVDVLQRIADVAERRLHDPAQALDAWLRIQAADPTDARASDAIERLSAATEKPIGRPPVDAIGDGPRTRTRLWLAGAEVAWLFLDDREGATAFVKRAIDADPEASAPRALLESLRTADAPDTVADRLRRRVEVASSGSEAVPALIELARLYADAAETVDAIRAWEHVVERVPDHPVALDALAGLYRLSGDFESEAETLTKTIEGAGDPVVQVTALVRLGHVHAEHLGQPDTAADAWEQAMEVAGDAVDAVHALRALCEQDADLELLSTQLTRLAEGAALPAEAMVWWMMVAELADAMDEPERAIGALERAREVDSRRVEPLLALERHWLSRRAFAELAALYEELAGRADAVSIRAEFRLNRARLAEGALDDLRMAFEAYEDVLTDVPDHPDALAWMEGWADRAGDLELLADVLERRLTSTEDERTRQMVLRRAGRVLREAGQLAESTRCYEAALAIEPDSPIALRAVRELYDEQGERERVIEMTAREGRACLDPTNASGLLVESGRGRQALDGDSDAALEDFTLALRRNPADDEALDAVRRACESGGRWTELAEALEVRGAALGDRAVLEEAIRIYVDRLAEPRSAIAVLKRLIPTVSASDVPPLLQQLADLYVELSDWPAAVATYRRLRTISPDAAMRRAVVFRLVAIYRDKAPDAEQARRWLRTMLDADPGDVDALERLADLELDEGLVDRARIALARAVNAADPGGRRAALRRRIARMDLEQGRVGAALAGLEAAVEDVPDDPRLLEALADASLDAGRPARARAALQRALTVADPRSGIAERLRQRVAEAALAEGTDPADLIRTLRSAVGERPDDRAMRQLFADALGRREEHLDEAIEQLRWLLSRAPLDPDHLVNMRRLLERAELHDAAGEIARLRVAAGIADEDDTRLLGGPGDGTLRLLEPLEAEVVERLWGEVDRGFISGIETLTAAVPSIFGPRPPCRPGDEALTREFARIAGLVGAEPPNPHVGPLPVDMVQQTGADIVVSERMLDLPEPERAFFIASAIELGRRGIDVVTRWAPDALRRRLMTIALAAGHPLKGEVPSRVRAQGLRLRGRYLDALRVPDTAEALSGLILAIARVPESARGALSAAHRVGLLAAGGVAPATRALARTEDGPGEGQALVELARFSTSAAYDDLRRRFGTPAA